MVQDDPPEPPADSGAARPRYVRDAVVLGAAVGVFDDVIAAVATAIFRVR